MTDPLVLFSLEGGIARVTLNRPERLNSLTAPMHRELRAAIEGARAGRARALLLTGTGRGFCAGQDLCERKAVAEGEPVDLGETIATHYTPLILALRTLEMPVICAVNGVAAGAGASIALACDIVLAARSASFIQAFCKIGLVPDAGGSWALPRRVGTARAMGLAMLGDTLPAQRAAEWGLIWKCVDDDRLMAEADELAARLAAAPTRALVATRQAIHAGGENGLERQLELERQLQRQLGFGHDYREGVTAFFEKRPPRFTGD